MDYQQVLPAELLRQWSWLRRGRLFYTSSHRHRSPHIRSHTLLERPRQQLPRPEHPGSYDLHRQVRRCAGARSRRVPLLCYSEAPIPGAGFRCSNGTSHADAGDKQACAEAAAAANHAFMSFNSMTSACESTTACSVRTEADGWNVHKATPPLLDDACAVS